MQIFVETFANARSIALDVENCTTIKQAKCQLDARLGIPSSKQRLLYGGKELDDDCTFEYYGTRKEDTFRLALSGLVGGGASRSKRKYSVNANKRSLQCPGTHKAICYALDLLLTHVLGNEQTLSLMHPELEVESQDAMKSLGMLARISPDKMDILYLDQLCDFLGHMSSVVPADMAELKQKIGKTLFKLTLLSGQLPTAMVSKVVMLEHAQADPRADLEHPEVDAVAIPAGYE